MDIKSIKINSCDIITKLIDLTETETDRDSQTVRQSDSPTDIQTDRDLFILL